jgi:hypothetical protein
MGIRPGSSIPLMAQLHDGVEDARVEALVRGPDGKEIATVKLTHLAMGFYASTEVKMPDDTDFVTAQYTVLDSDKYEITAETFYPERTEQGAKAAIEARDKARDEHASDFKVGRVVEESAGDFVEGKIRDEI